MDNSSGPRPSKAWRAGIITALLLAVILLAWRYGGTDHPTILTPPPPTRTPEPLVPTPLPTSARRTATPTSSPTLVIALPTASPTQPPATPTEPAPTAAPTAGTLAPDLADPVSTTVAIGAPGAPAYARVGVGVPGGHVGSFSFGAGMPGWYLNWAVVPDVDPPPGVEFAQMVRLYGPGFRPDVGVIAATASAHPGSLWLIGNEPDVLWQDDSTPDDYAHNYGIVYRAIKAADPTARVAIGGVSQPTPMRIAYLEQILSAYQAEYGAEMPIDVWNVHAFILREERDSWGVGIPPGFSDDQGQLFEIADHADMTLFKQMVLGFRQWMAEHGFQDKPLIISEYGILMPESYGFGPDVVTQFMTDTFDFFLTARDLELGMPEDDYRLVQAFCWYSASDTVYATPNLFDPVSGQPTMAGTVFMSYVAALR